ncbi:MULTISPECIES: symmetrical bis(5'-nucleosyl)-tetraphosphatase [unclassified Moraxella]|uniref:symmetrical bis(5'-nucleosyl)-tetraphosphatase n=1 Tax=unclassified Moraxella TaxID=2685852 RepID=UPI00359D8B74
MTHQAYQTYRHQYVIGDLQGCFGAFLSLLRQIDFDETKDKIWLAGDIVARGEDSLSTLREAKRLSDIGALTTVIGNHDITLIAVWRGIMPPKPKDKTAPIFDAPDCDELLNWLRTQPLLVFPSDETVLTHAGIPPNWSIDEANSYAKELQTALSGDLSSLDKLLPKLYSKKIEPWHDDIKGAKRLRLIANYLTRMRLCDKNGVLEFGFKEGLLDKMPTGYRPWFLWHAPRKRRVLFGHWAALQAKVASDDVRSLDGGCVWGGDLVAYRLSDGAVIRLQAMDI